MPLQSDKLRLLRRIPDIRFEEEPRGYSKDQVDRVLANLAPLADEIERLQARLDQAETRSASAEARLVEARSPSHNIVPDMPPAPQPDFDETLRNTLVSAQRQADTTIRESSEEAERIRTEAEFQSNALLADARDQSAEMTTEAVAYRERLMAEAATERTRLLKEASAEGKKRLQAVESELSEAHEQERARLVSQIGDLQQTHKLLQADVTRFEKHIEQRQADVRAALDDIVAVLDDPERLRKADGLEPAELNDFDVENYSPIAVEVVALDDLEAEAQKSSEMTDRPENVLHASDLDGVAVVSDAEEALDPGYQVEDTGGMKPTNGAAAQNVAVGADSVVDDETDNGLTLAEGRGLQEPDADPQLGVTTQVIPPPLATNEIGDVATGGEATRDPFIDELRRATSDEGDSEGDAISDFLDNNKGKDKGERGGSGWFGRRK